MKRGLNSTMSSTESDKVEADCQQCQANENEVPMEATGTEEEPSKIPAVSTQREDPSHGRRMLKAFCQLRSECKLCDFIVEIDGEEIPTHGAVLAASSKYFEAMLRHDTAEKKAGRVVMHGIELTAGKQCIDFMYTGKVNFSQDDPEILINAAELMQLCAVTDAYFEFLKRKTDIGNSLKCVMLAETYNRRSFAAFFKKFSAANFRDIIEGDNFAGMSQSLVEQCLEAISDIGENLDTLKWQGILKWVKCDEAERKIAFPNLFNYVKLENISEEYIKKWIGQEKMVTESDQCMKKVCDALSSRVTTEFAASVTSSPIIIYHQESKLIHQYDVDTEKWSRLARVPKELYDCNLEVVWCHRLYIGTGKELWKLGNAKWSTVVEIEDQDAPCLCKLTSYKNFLYMVTPSYVVKYDTFAERWEKFVSKLGLNSLWAVAATNQYLYAIIDSKSCREFDLETNIWGKIGSTKNEKRSLVFYRGKLFALGERCQKIEYYDPCSDSWGVLPIEYDLTYGVSYTNAFVARDKVYVVANRKNVTSFQLSEEECPPQKVMRFDSNLSCVAHMHE